MSTAKVSLYANGHGHTSFELHTKGSLKQTTRTWKERAPAVFLPSREILAMYEGFIAAYKDRELSFDETYYDACVRLNANPTKGARKSQADEILARLQSALGGHVELSGPRFYGKFHGDRARMEAHLVAEGLRKIASLERLLLNGSLTGWYSNFRERAGKRSNGMTRCRIETAFSVSKLKPSTSWQPSIEASFT